MSRKKAAPSAAWRNRIVGEAEVLATGLTANPRNWRTHGDQQRAALDGVLSEVGWVQRIVVNRTTNHIVDGHARVEQAAKRGESVPVVYVELTEREEALVLATLDPLGAMAGKDEDVLRGLIADIGDLQIAGIDDLLRSIAPPEKHAGLTDPDEAPPVPVEPVTRPGDCWLLGNHKLACGDSTDADTVARLLGAVKPLLMVTDPPYGVGYDPEWRERYDNFKRHATGKVANDERSDWREAWALFPGPIAYVWHGGLHSAVVAESLTVNGFIPRAQIIWRKQHFVFGRGDYHWQHEPCWYAVKGTGNWAGDRKQTTVWDIDNLNPMGGNKDEKPTGHGTQKPVECMRRPIINNSSPGQAVYDPFLGSGTTIIAAEMEGRSCYAIELEPKYVDVAVQRWQAFTGKEACNEDGETFGSIADSRRAASSAGVFAGTPGQPKREAVAQ